jgi:hypothetical protein
MDTLPISTMTKRLATGRKRSRGHANVLAISEQHNGHFAKEKRKKKNRINR